MEYAEAAKVITDYVEDNKIKFEDREVNEKKYQEFQKKYGPDVLENLADDELLDYVFLHSGDKNNLCYALEFDKDYEFAGGIGGGSSYKYSLYKNKEGKWIFGNSHSNKYEISPNEAIKEGRKIINALIESCHTISEFSLNTPKDYEELSKKLDENFKDLYLKPTSSWVHKYFHMIFPNKILSVHNDSWKKYYLDNLGINYTNSYYYNEGQIMMVVNKTGLNPVEFYNAFIIKFPTKPSKIWLLAPGEDAKLWNLFKEKNVIVIGWGEIGDLNNYNSINAIKKRLEKEFGGNQSINAKTLYNFSKEMKINDTVIVKTGINTILAVGKVKSNYRCSVISDKFDTYTNVRDVEWIKKGEYEVDWKLPIKTLTDYDDKGKIILKEYCGNKKSYTKEDFLNEVVFLEEEYDNLKNLLKRKKNLILQGAPGVGKTFIAKRLAYSIMEKRNEDRIEFIQFHQSYSYEDFIQGYKPTETGFELKNGVFYNFCKKAASDPNNDYYFIIDEINRGNISKIFGELMMLIEDDKRGKEFEINLTYGDEKFYVPENVYIIGMMNTADRSLAMIDYALRRRFVFYNVNPLFDNDKENNYILRDHLINKGIDKSLAFNIIEKLASLNRKILDDEDLGFGFRIGHSYFLGKGDFDKKWYKSIIKYEIAPILREYWFDDLDKAESEIDSLYNISDYNE